jgi:hypothetical protein
MKMIGLLLLCLFLISVSSVGQQITAPEEGSHDLSESGAAFLRVCDPPTESPNARHIHALCMAYVAGVSDGATLLATRKLDWLPFCLTPEADNWHLYRAVLQYLKAHPEKTDAPTRTLVLDGLISAFPCHPNK